MTFFEEIPFVPVKATTTSARATSSSSSRTLPAREPLHSYSGQGKDVSISTSRDSLTARPANPIVGFPPMAPKYPTSSHPITPDQVKSGFSRNLNIEFDRHPAIKFNNDLFKYNRKKLTQADILRNNPTFVDAARRTNK